MSSIRRQVDRQWMHCCQYKLFVLQSIGVGAGHLLTGDQMVDHMVRVKDPKFCYFPDSNGHMMSKVLSQLAGHVNNSTTHHSNATIVTDGLAARPSYIH